MRWMYLMPAAALSATLVFAQTAADQTMRAGALETNSKVPPASSQITDEPRAPISPEQRADIYMARKMYREAAETYLSIKPATHIILNKAGIAHHQVGDLDGAKKLYQRAIRMNKQYAEAHNNLGAVWYAKRSYRRAEGQYKKALKLTPYSASMHSNLGTAYFARKKYKQASESYARALELDPEVFEHRSGQGTLLQERSVEERAKFNFYLAKTYARAGVVERALLYMRKALEYGFKDRKKFLNDEDFASLHALAEFQELMQLEPRVL